MKKPPEQIIHDFLEALDDKFKRIEIKTNGLLYQVSEKETLEVTLGDEEFEADYTILLKDTSKRPRIQFTGSVIPTEKGYVERTIDTKSFQTYLNTLEYTSQSVNPHFALFGASKEERYVKGDLKEWDRIDGRMIMKGNLGKIMKRRRKWRKNHPQSDPNRDQTKFYGNEECLKARCIFYLPDGKECKGGYTPSNNKADTKLKGGTGYCPFYANPEMKTMESKLLKEHGYILLFQRFDFLQRIKANVKQLKALKPSKFHQYLAQPFFSRKKLLRLMELHDDRLDKQRERLLKQHEDETDSLLQQFTMLTHDLTIFIQRKTQGKPYKKAWKDYERALEELNEDMLNFERNLTSYIKDVKEYNRLIKTRFEPKPLKRLFSADSVKEGMLIYFAKSFTKETRAWRNRKAEAHHDVGRKKMNGDWIDVNLSPIGNIGGYNQTRHPIYKVLSVKKGYTTIKPLFRATEIRLLNTREYLARPLKFQKSRPPRKKKTISTQTALTAFLAPATLHQEK